MDEDSKSAAKDPSHRVGLDNEVELQSEYHRKVICCTNIAEVSCEYRKLCWHCNTSLMLIVRLPLDFTDDR